MPRRLLVTGSRDWTNEALIQGVLTNRWIFAGRPDDMVLVSGACPTGADRFAEMHWERLGLPVERYPANWATHGKAAGPIRNQQMVDTLTPGRDMCLAFPLGASRGTRDCLRRARERGIATLVTEG